jgi:hypothetical protein
MDVTGVVLAVAVAIVAGGLLYWHVQQVKKRPATGYDKMMGALWAALVVLALGRVAFLVSAGGGKQAEPATPAPATK